MDEYTSVFNTVSVYIYVFDAVSFLAEFSERIHVFLEFFTRILSKPSFAIQVNHCRNNGLL